jgi:hypothetical protein
MRRSSSSLREQAARQFYFSPQVFFFSGKVIFFSRAFSESSFLRTRGLAN